MDSDSKANILLSIINETRTEIRALKDNVNKYATLITVSSFGITAFLLKELKFLCLFKAGLLLAFIDISLIILLWAILSKLRNDLMFTRTSLEIHEKQLSTVCGISRNIKGEDGLWYFEFNPNGAFDEQKIIKAIEEGKKEKGSVGELDIPNKKNIKPDFKEEGVSRIGFIAAAVIAVKSVILLISNTQSWCYLFCK